MCLFKNPKRVYFITAVIYSVLTALIAVYNIFFSEAVTVIYILIAPLFLLIPVVYTKLFKIPPQYIFDAKLLIFIFLAYNMGICLRLYHLVPVYDIFAHGLSGIVFARIGVCIYLMIVNDKPNAARGKWIMTLFGLFFCSFTAVVWEIGEFVLSKLAGTDPQWVKATGVSDTMEDMIVCIIGAIIYCVVLGICLKRNKKTAVKYLTDGIM
ncbi:MAG: hypothetical protein IJF54_06885 [Clostridia bacterium]|nr:hypothetical protein [Clostridia bacterium]